MNEQQQYAAIDLGSVSFHFVVMSPKNGRLVWVDCKKEIIRLASGLNPETGHINADVERRALKTLNYFSRHLKKISATQCRVVGTSTFRKLRDNGQFLKKAEAALGQKIEVLSGNEEAEYIYRGVSYNLGNEKRIVLDIGGGSTEIVAGTGKNPEVSASIETGCITLTQKYFSNDKIDKEQFKRAELAAHDALSQVSHLFKDFQWESELGTSGSIKAISWAMQNLGIGDGIITRETISQLREAILSCQNISQLSKKIGLNYRRTSVFCGGFILIDQAFKTLGMSYLKIAQGAIREGIIDEMISNQSVQEQSA